MPSFSFTSAYHGITTLSIQPWRLHQQKETTLHLVNHTRTPTQAAAPVPSASKDAALPATTENTTTPDIHIQPTAPTGTKDTEAAIAIAMKADTPLTPPSGATNARPETKPLPHPKPQTPDHRHSPPKRPSGNPSSTRWATTKAPHTGKASTANQSTPTTSRRYRKVRWGSWNKCPTRSTRRMCGLRCGSGRGRGCWRRRRR